MQMSAEQQRQAFSIWLRTGRLPRQSDRELKFNPWHDPRNGRFTFAGSGRYFALAGRGSATDRAQGRPPIVFPDDPALPVLTSAEEIDAWAAKQRAKLGGKPGFAEAIEARRQLYLKKLKPLSSGPLGKGAEFAGGLAEGIYDLGKATVAGLYSLATTNPATSLQNIEFALAGIVDGAIAAEDTPAYVQLTNAAHSIANASAHDLGYGIATIAGNIALTVAPQAAASKFASAARIGRARKIIAAPDRTRMPPVPRSGPKGVDPLHHNANALVRNASGDVVVHQRFVSGNMTPEEQALGFPKNTLASHTEARAVQNVRLKQGDHMTITGQNSPCKLCRGVMRRAAAKSGATIEYRWRENGKSKSWTARPQ
jgi:hypothetical protein